MSSYRQNLKEEMEYLDKTLNVIKCELEKERKILSERKGRLLQTGKEMWEDTVHFTTDFEKLTEVSQYLSVINSQTASYSNTFHRIKNYGKMLDSPYFGRFDFVEDGDSEKEKIYIGLHNVVDSQTHEIIVYDWRAPISSIFYQYELGEAAYMAPLGNVTGKVLLKRQYKIQNGQIKYFFDCSIRINDEVLQEVLCRNSSTKMRSIVETIQKEQDIIIRDTDNELLIVQGMAGSGKTSVALHRIAFLLYHGMNDNISSNNILIISPNTVFSKYISSVLPELGEENVEQVTFDELSEELLDKGLTLETRNMRFESFITSQYHQEMSIRKQGIALKGSRAFVRILDRLIQYYEHNMIDFDDIYYDGKVIETKQRLKNLCIHDQTGMPLAKRLKRIESIILDKIHPLQRQRVKKIERLVQKMDGHEFDIKPFSRLLSMKESGALLKRMKQFTQINTLHVYRVLFEKEGLFSKLAQGLELPDNIGQIISATASNLYNGYVYYEDCAPLLYLKLKLEGSSRYSEIKQVVIDEAQDYSPMQYEIFNLLFKDARYTVLGDIHQSIDKDVHMSLYDTVEEIFDKKKSVKLFLNKSYRSSYEISTFAQKILRTRQNCEYFERHEPEPNIIYEDTVERMNFRIIEDIRVFTKQEYESIAVICKTATQSKELYDRLKGLSDVKLMDTDGLEIEKGIIIIPAYMAKGLEFDVVLVYNVCKENYSSELDRTLLYIACTRAMHRLVLYYTGEKSILI